MFYDKTKEELCNVRYIFLPLRSLIQKTNRLLPFVSYELPLFLRASAVFPREWIYSLFLLNFTVIETTVQFVLGTETTGIIALFSRAYRPAHKTTQNNCHTTDAYVNVSSMHSRRVNARARHARVPRDHGE